MVRAGYQDETVQGVEFAPMKNHVPQYRKTRSFALLGGALASMSLFACSQSVTTLDSTGAKGGLAIVAADSAPARHEIPSRFADDAQRATRDSGERGQHGGVSHGKSPAKCPDGGERLPREKRSPLDSIPPLSPLVA